MKQNYLSFSNYIRFFLDKKTEQSSVTLICQMHFGLNFFFMVKDTYMFYPFLLTLTAVAYSAQTSLSIIQMLKNNMLNIGAFGISSDLLRR